MQKVAQSAAVNVALNRKVQGGDPRSKSGGPTSGIAQHCCQRVAKKIASAQGLLDWQTLQGYYYYTKAVLAIYCFCGNFLDFRVRNFSWLTQIVLNQF